MRPTAHAITFTERSADGSGTAKVLAASLALTPSQASQWEIARSGVTGVGAGFAAGSTVTVTIGGRVAGQAAASAAGEIEFHLTASLPVGTTEVVLTSGANRTSAVLRVLADSAVFDPADHDPVFFANRRVVKVSELAASPVTFTLRDWPSRASVDIALNGRVVDTVSTNSIGFADYSLTERLSAASYTISATHPAGVRSVKLDVVPDKQGTPPTAGKYTGTGVQTQASSRVLESRTTRPIAFDVDAAGRISNLVGEYFWACVAGGGYHGSGTSEFSGLQLTPITVGRPFEIRWETVSTAYTLIGQVDADGSASGTVRASVGVCGSSVIEWSTKVASSKYVRTAPYTLPGTHTINGREWKTVCEPYSRTERCRTDIRATTVAMDNGRFVRRDGWAFNNLTYLPYMTRASWGSNPLAVHNMNGFSSGGRQWRTECDTAQTGRGACRSYTMTTVYAATAASGGGYTFSQSNQWVFNNIVMFGGPAQK
ncbi:hypothetical protein GCM10025789_20550 [Tessaracoccus lubricantis]|uniref:DUF4397 domain-containing protein n=2 Tax=Tessaracoccus lubricantis TaxID=545543 RepID=A0ABP9FHI8_9ACTN